MIESCMISSKLFAVLSRKKSEDTTDNDNTKLARVLGLRDLTMLGVGTTLGLGVYVLAGTVAVNDAGPAVAISFLIAAIASAFAGVCYAEFASRVPKAGSAYVYCYVTVGEFSAFIIGWNLILEYAIGTASVAKGLSNYLDASFGHIMRNTLIKLFPIHISFLAEYPDFFACGIVILLSVLLAWGVKESTNVNNVFTTVNLITVSVVIIAGIFKASPSYWNIPLNDIPADKKAGSGGFMPFGWAGVLAGTAKCFFGFVGFDVIATTGDEANNPKRNIPLAIGISLIIIFFAYFGVATVLTMMVPYYLQDENAPLPYAFEVTGLQHVRWIVVIGAICALFASLLGAIFPLPRILYSMAEDGLLFKWFSSVNATTKTPINSTLLSGIFTGVIAGIFNLQQLIDMMSIGTLLAYTIVALCILILRFKEAPDGFKEPTVLFQNSDSKSPNFLFSVFEHLKVSFNLSGLKQSTSSTETVAIRATFSFALFSSLLSFIIIYGDYFIKNTVLWSIIIVTFSLLSIISVFILHRQPQTETPLLFKVPLVPILPCCSIFMNIFLMLKLDVNTWVRFIIWLVIGLLIYVFYALEHSVQGIQDRSLVFKGNNVDCKEVELPELKPKV